MFDGSPTIEWETRIRLRAALREPDLFWSTLGVAFFSGRTSRMQNCRGTGLPTRIRSTGASLERHRRFRERRGNKGGKQRWERYEPACHGH